MWSALVRVVISMTYPWFEDDWMVASRVVLALFVAARSCGKLKSLTQRVSSSGRQFQGRTSVAKSRPIESVIGSLQDMHDDTLP